MYYQYTCSLCGDDIEIEQSPNDPIPSKVDCVICRCKECAPRNWKGIKIHIPDWFKSGNWDNDDNNPASRSHISKRIQHSRPSGREKVYY